MTERGTCLVRRGSSPLRTWTRSPVWKNGSSAGFLKGRKMYRITFSAGNLVVQVFGHDFPTTLNIEGPPEQAQLVRRIWPITGRFKWPPPRSLDEIGGLEGLHRAFDEPR